MDTTRSEVQEKIKELVQTTKDSTAVKNAVETWLRKKKCSDLEVKQILRDLTSYQEYLDIGGLN